MEKMHQQRNEVDKNGEQNVKTVSKSASTKKSKAQVITETTSNFDINCERTLSNQESAKEISDSKACYETSNIQATTSCTSSTDSGVNISDNDETYASPPPTFLFSREKTITVNNFNKEYHKNKDSDKNVNKNIKNNCIKNAVVGKEGCDGEENCSTNFNKESKSRMKQQNLTQHLQVVNNYNSDEDNRNQTNQNFAGSENAKKLDQQRNVLTATTIKNEELTLQRNIYNYQQGTSISTPPSPSVPSSLSESSAICFKDNPPSNVPPCNSSPVVSIRSICSSTIITSDSDSDISVDIEGVHENYVIKKLGTQVTFPPKHPEIPNINSGHTLLNQQVQAVSDPQQLSPLAALAAIGDTFGQAQALGAVPSVSQRPQIGSIALSNSSDVTFGDKHFYEGPVTIQQFLIDSRDKWKDSNRKDNSTSVNENPNITKDINLSSAKSGKVYEYILKRKKVVVPCILAIATVLIVGIIFGVLQNESKSKIIIGNNEESRKNIPINSTIGPNSSNIHDENCSGNGTFCLITRDVWRAHPQKSTLDKQKLPLRRAIISHTASQSCDSLRICSERVRVIQEFHMNSFGWYDIGYNFLISSDGYVYEGRGWDAVGAHTKGYNTGSVGITFIGTYMSIPPTEAQLKACLALLDEGLRLNKLAENYHVYGARQFAATESPGDMLYKQIKKWTRWSSDINLN